MSGEVKCKKIIQILLFSFPQKILLSHSRFQHVLSFLIFTFHSEFSEETNIAVKLPEVIILAVFLIGTL